MLGLSQCCGVGRKGMMSALEAIFDSKRAAPFTLTSGDVKSTGSTRN